MFENVYVVTSKGEGVPLSVFTCQSDALQFCLRVRGCLLFHCAANGGGGQGGRVDKKIYVGSKKMPRRTKAEKREYHRKYYQDHIERLQGLARIRYWAMVYRMKTPSYSPPNHHALPKIQKTTIIKGDFTLTFD